uniref:NADH dehydrogenase subunit 4L n=1 Tax=Brevicoryne brassicae TaxID=69196 RepID=A0A7T1W6S4_BREBR|nr:NADH dehydrogenase subunit 4L [Brevicoryne brassicae]QPO84589.1 NADH dehydrogenase subunit 4L [Brevicoryne brassicae]UGY85918.1 NADH dehydrogenase subunit 4L [Brevicoryne brassicae]
MNLFILVLIFMLFSGVLFYIFNFNHLLMMLLGLEYLLLILSLLFLLNLMMFIKQYLLLLIFFIFCISESVLGLTILILMVRMYGNDYLKSLMILQC